MNTPQHQGMSGHPGVTDSSFGEVSDTGRRTGPRTDGAGIKVDAQYLIETLGEKDAKNLAAFFNKQSFSMDLLTTHGIWIPEWCIHLLRKLVFRLSATCTATPAKTHHNDERRYFGPHPDEIPPNQSSSSSSYAVPGEKSSTPEKMALNEENVPQSGDFSDLPDLRNASFEEITHALRRMAAQTEDGVITVDSEYLIEKLGEDDAKQLVSFFNKESTSMDLVITDRAWGLNRHEAETAGDKYTEIPEWCIRFLRKLAIALSTTNAAMLVRWKKGREEACGILQETLHDMDASLQKANEIHAATMNDMKEDLRRAKVAHEEILRKLQPIDEDSPKAEQWDSAGEYNCRGGGQKSPSAYSLDAYQRGFKSPNDQAMDYCLHQLRASEALPDDQDALDSAASSFLPVKDGIGANKGSIFKGQIVKAVNYLGHTRKNRNEEFLWELLPYLQSLEERQLEELKASIWKKVLKQTKR